MVDVVAHKNAAGDIAIGVAEEGAFVPLISMSAARVAQYVERHNTLAERAGEGDEVAKDVLGSAYKEPEKKGGDS